MRRTPHSASPAGLNFLISAALRTTVGLFRTGRPVIVIPDDVSGFSICDGSLDWEGGHGRPLLPDKFAKVLLKVRGIKGICGSCVWAVPVST